ncbi:MAG TPA: valine--tRNA ligase [Gemmatimonadales bacterium]|nr:valine--tRNA ligase [Gemmatimonadales bacterium]
MTEPLSPTYSPAGLEAGIYRQWQEAGVFAPRAEGRDPFVVMMPPPNVTAHLHMGHGLNNTLQDVLARWARMQGRPTLWVPGTDHAGIATQNVVERLLAKEGQTRFDLGREPFLDRMRAYVAETGATILQQLRSIGSSADWGRTYYTFDEHYSRAVREVFVQLYERGRIYRGKYIINWCPRCLTALSNEEAEKEERDGRIWHLRYPLADGSGSLVVATTRPETMLGDSAVAVHPDDERYRALVGKELALPLTDRRIPIVADAAVDPAFGSGAVKVTPAHDPTDFEIGKRHGLAQIDVMTPEARMAETVPARFQGLDRYEARKRVVAEFEALGLLVKVEEHRHAVGHCYRCGTVVEPRLSDQWFVAMAPLAAPALEAYRTGKVTFVPERWGEIYTQWLEGIRDWCISRQLWWGHRIPVWYCDACGTMHASRTDLTACPACRGPVRQDEDVLDTWFSSWLVPMASLGWPDETPDLRRYYPGTVLITAPEILFFWVARMIMAGLEFRGEVPFRTVYLHGTVRDTQHRKMSKSLGNGIDPLDVIGTYGADALRYTVVSGMSVGTDLILDPKDLETSFAPGRNFANKLWNAARFLLSNLDGAPRPLAGRYPDVVRPEELTLADRWIIARCDAAVRAATEAMTKFRLNDAAGAAYHFLWSDFADWYVEAIKPRLYGDAPGGDVARAVAYRVFDTALRLLHPVMPFITEAVWQRLPGRRAGELLATAAWPRPDARARHDDALAEFALVQEVVTALRQIRAEYGVEPGKGIEATVTGASAALRNALRQEEGTVRRLAKLSALAVGNAPAGAAASAVLSDGSTLVVPLGGMVDLQKECARLGAERDRLAGLVANQEKKLANEQFTSRAPAAVVEGERKKLADWQEQVAKLEERRKALGCT